MVKISFRIKPSVVMVMPLLGSRLTDNLIDLAAGHQSQFFDHFFGYHYLRCTGFRRDGDGAAFHTGNIEQVLISSFIRFEAPMIVLSECFLGVIQLAHVAVEQHMSVGLYG